MKTTSLKMAFAGIAIAIVSFTAFFASNSIHAQNEEAITNETSFESLNEEETLVADCQAQCTNKSDCIAKCENISDCDPSKCDEECMAACQEKVNKTCEGNATCSSSCKK